jgi:C4-dicarboxylate-specific signal transduction histidine kinase
LQAIRKSILTRSVLNAALWSGALALAVAAVAFVYARSERNGYAQLDEQLAYQLDLYGAALESELGKHEYFPGIVALDDDVQALLEDPGKPRLAERANKRLASLNVRAGSLAIFVADLHGQVRAASNWYQP